MPRCAFALWLCAFASALDITAKACIGIRFSDKRALARADVALAVAQGRQSAQIASWGGCRVGNRTRRLSLVEHFLSPLRPTRALAHARHIWLCTVLDGCTVRYVYDMKPQSQTKRYRMGRARVQPTSPRVAHNGAPAD